MARYLVALVAFLALQATCNAALSLSPNALLQQLMDQVKTLQTQIGTAVQQVEDTVIDNTDKAVTKIHDDIQTISQQVKTQVEPVVAKFEAAGKNLVECSEKIPSEINELITNTTQKAGNCVATEVEDGKSIVVDLITSAKNLNNTVANLQTDLSACSQNIFTSVTCSISVITKATAVVASSSTSIVGDITKASALVAGFPMDINSCESAVFQSIPSEVENLISAIAACYTS